MLEATAASIVAPFEAAGWQTARLLYPSFAFGSIYFLGETTNMNSFLKRSALVAAIVLALPAAASAASFAATGTGAIPDNLPAGLVMSFAVTGSGTPASVGIGMTATHSWVGDLTVTLAAPGGAPAATIFARPGRVGGTGFGSANDLSGTYAFFDTHPGDFWAAAGANPVAPGNYFPSAAGAATLVPINPVFAGLTPAQTNGTWTLTVVDAAGGDLGNVTSATLFINQTTPVSLQNFSVD